MLLFWRTLVATILVIAHHEKTSVEARAMDKEHVDPLQTLSAFNGYAYDYRQGPVGVYSFYYNLPHSSRYEERTASGEVKGNYAYVAPEGNEFKFKYEAGKKGFQVESNALPTAPEDTEEVKKAKQEFFEAYERALAQTELEGYGRRRNGASRALHKEESKLVKGFERKENKGIINKHEDGEDDEEEENEEGDEKEEDEGEEDEEDDEEEDEEESSAESSEENDDYKNDYEESSEESDDDDDDEEDDENEESSEEDDDDEESSEESSPEDGDENEEDVRKYLNKRIQSGFSRRKSSSYVIPNYIYKNRIDIPKYRKEPARTYSSRGRSLHPKSRRYKRNRNS